MEEQVVQNFILIDNQSNLVIGEGISGGHIVVKHEDFGLGGEGVLVGQENVVEQQSGGQVGGQVKKKVKKQGDKGQKKRTINRGRWTKDEDDRLKK